jgi:hypothetical protein
MERIPLLEHMILRYRNGGMPTCRRFAGDVGMKASKMELIRLARLVQRDIAGGHVSKNARQAVEVLSDYENAAVDLLDLALEEATKDDKSLFDSLSFLFGQFWRLCGSILSQAIGWHRNSRNVLAIGYSTRAKPVLSVPPIF